MQWRIRGVDRKRGEEIPPFIVEADSEEKAIAAKRGVMVSSINSYQPSRETTYR